MNARRSPLVAATVVLVALAACAPPPSGPAVPDYYPTCVGSPSCVVIREGGSTIALPSAVAISDDGRVMATTRRKPVARDEFGEDVFTQTLALVGIDDRWYREVAVTEPNGGIGGVAMTPNAQRLVFVGGPLASPTHAADGSPLAGVTALFVYDGATKKVTRTAFSSQVWDLSISDDGRFVAASSVIGVVILDLLDGTTRPTGIVGYQPRISGDGRYVVWSDQSSEPGSFGGVLTRYDRTDGTSVVLPGRGDDPSISRDGSRISSHRNPLGCCHAERVQYLDVGDADWTTVAEATYGGLRPLLSADGGHLFYSLSDDMFTGVIYDHDLATGSAGVLAAPLAALSAMSPNGNHVLYWSPLGIVRWNR